MDMEQCIAYVSYSSVSKSPSGLCATIHDDDILTSPNGASPFILYHIISLS